MLVPPHNPLNKDANIPARRFVSVICPSKREIFRFLLSGVAGAIILSLSSIKDSISSAIKGSEDGAERFSFVAFTSSILVLSVEEIILALPLLLMAAFNSFEGPFLLIAAFKSWDECIRFLTPSLSSSSPTVSDSLLLFLLFPPANFSISISLFFVGARENMDIPIKPIIKVPHAQHAPSLDLTRSSKTIIPQKNEVKTITDDHVPTATASPAVRMPYIPAHPPGTQKSPDKMPHFVN
mmetsp:Transcript_8814/g.19780  ORF Transcript_8814/g.19780 Transcript_8814/m.19780 type:complete len:238 (+) Transcript_8814:3704-4417(+)